MSRVRTNTFHHCLVPVQAVTNNLETFDDLQQLCRKVAECDIASSEGACVTARDLRTPCHEYMSDATIPPRVYVHVDDYVFFDFRA